jgi:hypothetical protein
MRACCQEEEQETSHMEQMAEDYYAERWWGEGVNTASI